MASGVLRRITLAVGPVRLVVPGLSHRVEVDMSMTDDRGATAARPVPSDFYGEEGLGWLFFAGTILGLMGIMRIIDAIWAFGYNGALPENLKDGVIGDSLTSYAWMWLIVGIILLLSSFAVLSRSQFARWIGIAATAIAAVTALTWMPYYPVWSLIYMLMAIFALYGLAVHGGRLPA
jgi:hypothetical protein